MPIYEFYCHRCHTIFAFLAHSPAATRRPSCPRCGRPELPKRPSTFATLRHRTSDDESGVEGVDEQRLEGAMQTLMTEMGGIDDDMDARGMGAMMRRFSEISGLEMGERLEETLGRIEAGEDLEAIEAEMDEQAEGEDLEDFFELKKKMLQKSRASPEIDDQLYFL